MNNNSENIEKHVENIVFAARRLAPALDKGQITLELNHHYQCNSFMSALWDLYSEVKEFCRCTTKENMLMNRKVKETVRAVLVGEGSVTPCHIGGSDIYENNLIRILTLLKISDMIDFEDFMDFLQINNMAKSSNRSEEEFNTKIFMLYAFVECNIIAETNELEITQTTMSPELRTPEAMELWQRLQRAEVVDENFMPINLSDNKASILAYRMMAILRPSPGWKAFEVLWNRNNLATKLVRAQEGDYYSGFCQYIDNILKQNTLNT